MIETERLILRNFKISDYKDFKEFACEEGVGPFAFCDEEIASLMIQDYIKLSIKKSLRFAIVLKSTNKVIGVIDLMNPHQERFKNSKITDNSKEVGFTLTKSYWHQGIMSEALGAIVKLAFEELNLRVLYACNTTANIGSSRVQEKCGFNIIGTHVIYDNDSSVIERCITNEDYQTFKKIRNK